MTKKSSLLAAEILLDLKCINFSPKKQFKLTSGKKSPIYCDCRRIISFPKERKKLIELGVKKLIKKLIILMKSLLLQVENQQVSHLQLFFPKN